MRKLILLSILIFSAFTALAQTAKITKFRIETNVYENGVWGVRIHTHFTTYGMLNSRGSAVAFFEAPRGRKIRDTNNYYRSSDGYVSVYREFTPNYETCYYNDFTLFIPNSELHSSNYTEIWCRVSIYNYRKREYMTYSDQIRFTINGNTNGSRPSYDPYNPGYQPGYDPYYPNGGYKPGYDPYYPNGGYQPGYDPYYPNGGYQPGYNPYYPNGGYYPSYPSQQQQQQSQSQSQSQSQNYPSYSNYCNTCHGTGTCSYCNGKGKIYNSYSRRYETCTYCRGNGRCSYCRGTGSV